MNASDARLNKEEVLNSLRQFKRRRDDLLHEDVATFDHNFERFLEYCDADLLARSVLSPIEAKSSPDVSEWWGSAIHRPPRLSFPANADEELALRYRVIKSVKEQPAHCPRPE